MSLLAKVSNEPIPGYTLRNRIGAGGYGEVWKAEAPGELFKALKFVYGYLDEDRAARELKALSRIRSVRHPFLLSLERIEVVEGQLVIVTELADGSLKDRYEECKRLGNVGIPRDELLVYMRDAADALDYMSAQHSLQHLDVKPENLLLVGGRIKVADFGLVKDLQEVSVSMLGGLTPLYAPPELFDGTPCPRSDQYSLAIVYQEMLTGVLPFPGTTAAQLATQHINSRPRLASLPFGDQSIIGQALSKDSNQRFVSCRAMVESLCRAGETTTTQYSPGRDNPAGKSSRETDHPSDNGSETCRKSSSQREIGWPAFPGTETYEAGAGQRSKSSSPPVLSEPRAPVVNALVPLPPPDGEATRGRIRPTLVIGIGGAGSQVLARLHRRRLDRYGAKTALNSFPLLLLDTDSQALQQVAFGDESAVGGLETLAVPLRKPQDYRNDTKSFAKSTSRRWLYNIPRSLQTDGLRPLGRLAFADHAPLVCARIRAAITRMLAPESISEASKVLGAELASAAPRVLLVASISGGAGSGMVLESAYAVRKVLHEMGLPQELCGLLVHATPRNQAGRDLAASNAVACLGELQQYSAPAGGYPGDPACGLPPFAAGTPTFDSAYLLHLGEQLGSDEFERAANQVAEYVYLDVLSDVGAKLRADRTPSESQNVAGVGQTPCTVRTFGLCQIGGRDDQFAAAALEVLCQQVAQAWLGLDRGTADAEQLAQAKASELELDFDRLTKQVQQLARTELRGAPTAATEKAWGNRLNTCAMELADPLVEWVLGLVDQTGVRVRGAQAAAAWLVTRLRQFDEQGKGLLERTAAEQAELESILAAVASGEKTKSKSRQPQMSAPEIEQKRVVAAQLGQTIVALRAARQVLQAICAKVVLASERLRDLARDVQFLGTQFPVLPAWEEPSPPNPPRERGLADEVRATARQTLRGSLAELTRELEATFETVYLARHGGLLAQFNAPALRDALVAALKEQARAAVVKSLHSVDVAAALLPANKSRQWTTTQLRECLAAAQPKLAVPGATSRLLLLLPSTASSVRACDFLKCELEQQPEPYVTSESGVTFLMESQGLSLEAVARILADDRPDYVEAASRLHARNDITWIPLLKV